MIIARQELPGRDLKMIFSPGGTTELFSWPFRDSESFSNTYPEAH